MLLIRGQQIGRGGGAVITKQSVVRRIVAGQPGPLSRGDMCLGLDATHTKTSSGRRDHARPKTIISSKAETGNKKKAETSEGRRLKKRPGTSQYIPTYARRVLLYQVHNNNATYRPAARLTPHHRHTTPNHATRRQATTRNSTLMVVAGGLVRRPPVRRTYRSSRDDYRLLQAYRPKSPKKHPISTPFWGDRP